MFKLNAKFDADSLLYSPSHFEYDNHTVHMLTQQCLLPPLTSTVKSSSFTHAHSSPLSLAGRLHQCHANCSHHINSDGLFLDRPRILVLWWPSLLSTFLCLLNLPLTYLVQSACFFCLFLPLYVRGLVWETTSC